MPTCPPPLHLNISRDGPELKAQCVQIEIFGAVFLPEGGWASGRWTVSAGSSTSRPHRPTGAVRDVRCCPTTRSGDRVQVRRWTAVGQTDAWRRVSSPASATTWSSFKFGAQFFKFFNKNSTPIVFSNLAPNVTPFCRPSTINLTVQHSLRRSSRHARHPSACGALARYRSSLQTLLADPPALHNISIKQNKNGPFATTFTEKQFHFFIENWPIYPLKRIKVNSIKFFFHFHVHFSFICFLTLCQGQVERYGREQRTLRPAAVDWRRHRSWRLRELCQARGKGQQ